MTDTSARLDRLVAALPGAGVELMLVTDLTNVRYLTGFTGSNGVALVGPDVRIFVTDSRYVEQAAEQVDPSFDRREMAGRSGWIAGVMPDGARAGFEDATVTVSAHAEFLSELAGRAELVAAGELVSRLREVKDADELARIAAAAELADAALRELLEQGIAGRTEAEVALALDDAMRRRGASGPSFETIVAPGAHGARPHARPRDVAIPTGVLVTIDWGAVVDGYCSDCTRTLATGPIAEADQVLYDLVREAERVGVEALAPGAGCRAVDAAARRVIEDAGHGAHFGHGLGHGVGLEVHEGPSLSPRAPEDATLAAGTVVTVEPGVYVPGQAGVRIEDLCVVTDAGPEILTHVPTELITVS